MTPDESGDKGVQAEEPIGEVVGADIEVVEEGDAEIAVEEAAPAPPPRAAKPTPRPPTPPPRAPTPPPPMPAAASAATPAPSPAPRQMADSEPIEVADAEPEPVRFADLVGQAEAEARQLATPEGAPRRIARYEAEIAALSQGEADRGRVALYQHEIGELLESAGDEGAAVKAYAKALQSDPTLRPNLWAIRRIFQQRELWPNLLKLLDAEIRFAGSDAERAELLVEKGNLLEDRLDQGEQALQCYLKATEIAPATISAWMALEKIYARNGDVGGLARVYRGLADATAEPGRKVALLLDLARIVGLTGEPPERTLEIHREAFQAAGADGERVLDEMERVAESTGRHEDLLWALEARAVLLARRREEASISERFSEGDQLVAVRRRQARVARDRLEDPARAWHYLSEAAQIAPDDPLIVEELAELAGLLGRGNELVTLLDKRLERASPRQKIELSLEKVEALRRAGRVEEAAQLDAELRAAAPHHLGLLVSRESEALRRGDLEGLARLAVEEAEIAAARPTPDAAWGASALCAAGALYGDLLGRDAEAEPLFERARALQPGCVAAVGGLLRLYQRQGRHEDAARLCSDEAARSEGTRRLEWLDTLAALREEALGDAAGAAQALRQLLAERPDDVALRLRVVGVERAAGRFKEAADELAEAARRLPAESRVELLLLRGEILERNLGDETAALATYREVLQVLPGEARAKEAFESLSHRRTSAAEAQPAAAAADWDELAAALQREAEASLQPARVAAALLELGEINERERHRPEEAVRAYRDLLDRSPGHLPALRGAARAHQALGEWARVAEARAEEAGLLKDDAARARAYVRLGELYEDQLKKDEEADEAYREAVALAGGVHAALGALRVTLRRKDAARFADALGGLEPLLDAADGEALFAFLDERQVAAQLAGDVEAADSLAAQLGEAGGATYLPAALAAWRSAARGDDPALLGDALERAAALVNEPRARLALLARAGFIATALGQNDKARTRLAEALKLAPADPALVVALSDVGADAEVLKERTRHASSGDEAALRMERAELLAGAGRLGAAAAELSRVLAADPHHVPALDLARRVAAAGGDRAGCARATWLLAAEVTDAERSAALFSAAGALYEELGQASEAAAAFRAVLDRTPHDGAAFRHARALLESLHQREPAPGPLVELLSFRIEHAEAPDRIELLLDRAALFLEAGDRVAAERDLRAVLAAEPDHLEAMRRLADLIGAVPASRPEALELYARYLAGETDGEARRRALRKMAELEEAAGDRIDAAVAHLNEAIALAPTPADSLEDRERLVALFERQRRLEEAVRALAGIAELAPDPRSRAAVTVRGARLMKDALGDARAAADAVTDALTGDPANLEALALLHELTQTRVVVQLELDDRLDRAIGIERERVAADAAAAEPYQALVRLYGWKGDEDARLVAAQAHALVTGEASPPRDAVLDPARELAAASWGLVFGDAAGSVAMEVWRIAQEASLKLYGPSAESFGVGKAERVNPKVLAHEWPHVDKTARALGVTGYELYVSRERERCEVGGGFLLVGQAFQQRLSAAARFRLGRALGLLRDRLAPLERIEAAELRLFFAACARVAEAARPAVLGRLDEAQVEERARSVGKILARRDRKQLAAMAGRFAELPDPEVWRRQILDGTTRLGLALSGDLAAVLEALGHAPTDAAAAPLFSFAVSDTFQRLRRELGLRVS